MQKRRKVSYNVNNIIQHNKDEQAKQSFRKNDQGKRCKNVEKVNYMRKNPYIVS